MFNIFRFPLWCVLCLMAFNISSYAETRGDTERLKDRRQSAMKALYEAGEKAIQEKRWKEALHQLEKVAVQYPDNPYAEKAELSMVVCYIEEKQFLKALITVNAFIDHYPQSEWLNYAIELKNNIKVAQNAPKQITRPNNSRQTKMEADYQSAEEDICSEQWNVALRKLQLFNIRYPNNPYTEKAELSIIICYVKQREFNKALNAINDFIEHYPKSEWLAHILKLEAEVEKAKKINNFWINVGISIVCVPVLVKLLLDITGLLMRIT